jgi:chromosome segregation ATPase
MLSPILQANLTTARQGQGDAIAEELKNNMLNIEALFGEIDAALKNSNTSKEEMEVLQKRLPTNWQWLWDLIERLRSIFPEWAAEEEARLRAMQANANALNDHLNGHLQQLNEADTALDKLDQRTKESENAYQDAMKNVQQAPGPKKDQKSKKKKDKETPSSKEATPELPLETLQVHV